MKKDNLSVDEMLKKISGAVSEDRQLLERHVADFLRDHKLAWDVCWKAVKTFVRIQREHPLLLMERIRREGYKGEDCVDRYLEDALESIGKLKLDYRVLIQAAKDRKPCPELPPVSSV